jgi:hypothetical protein
MMRRVFTAEDRHQMAPTFPRQFDGVTFDDHGRFPDGPTAGTPFLRRGNAGISKGGEDFGEK